MKRRLAFFALVLAFTALACQLIAGIDRVSTEERPERLPDPPDVYEAAPPIPDPCEHVMPPPPPLTDDEPAIDKQLPTFALAMSEFHLLARNDAGTLVGFDQDGVCTCDDRPATAHDGGPSCIGPVMCDADGGVDNGSSTIFDKFGTIVPDLDKAANINKHIMLGESGTLIEFSNYNGRANDKAVNVGIIVSNGINDGSGCGTNDGGPPPYPAGFCGNDIWTVDPTGVIGDRPPYASSLSAAGYVTNHTLVINDPTGYFEVPFGDVRLRLYSPIVTATIVPLDANGNPRDPNAPPPDPKDRYYALEDGRFAGRLSAVTILAASGALRQPGSADADAGEKYFCQSSAFPVLTAALCGARDIASSRQVDFDPKATCDALSATSSFRAGPATVGDKFPGSFAANPCVVGDGGVSASVYQCPP
jgi:hypothetical protein